MSDAAHTSYLSSEGRYTIFDIEREADAADVIISGYAIAWCDEGLRVLNLNNGKGAAVFMPDGTLIETNMDESNIPAWFRTGTCAEFRHSSRNDTAKCTCSGSPMADRTTIAENKPEY